MIVKMMMDKVIPLAGSATDSPKWGDRTLSLNKPFITAKIAMIT